MYTPPPQSRRPVELLLSLHYFPLATATTVTCAGFLFQALSIRWTLCLALPLAAVSLVTHLVEPIVTLSSVGGRNGFCTLELYRHQETSAPPLTLFLPTSSSSPTKLDFTPSSEKLDEKRSTVVSAWLPFQDVRYLDGMARYAHFPAFLLRDMKFTRVRHSQPSQRLPLLTAHGRPRPIVIFSHGLAGFPRLYSSLLMDVAARGMLVIAMSHQDGSAAFCRDARNDFALRIDTTLDWEVETREKQMMIRVKETRATLDRLQSGELLRDAGYAEAEVQAFLDATSGRPSVTLVGHSFGGATVMGAAVEEEADKAGAPTSRVQSVVTFDPWGQPLSGSYFRKAIAEHRKKYTTPTLHFHSEDWMRWTECREFLSDLAKDVTETQSFTPEEVAVLMEAGRRTAACGLASEASWYTIRNSPGTGHLSCCDLALLSPIVYKRSYVNAPPRAAIVDWANACVKFALAHDPAAAGDNAAAELDAKDQLVSTILTRQREAATAMTDTSKNEL